jgi:hypothetical protein
MVNLKSYLIAGMCLTSAAMFAQKTVPYASSIGDADRSRISTDWTVINANDDAKKWAYSEYEGLLKLTGNVAGALYERSLETPKDADDWIVSPAITIEQGKKYKISWWSLTHGFNENYELVMGTAATKAALTASDATTLFAIQDYQNFMTGDHNIMVMTAEQSGDFYFGFHCSSLSTGYRLYLTGFEIADFVLTPAAVTNLTATNEGEEMNVTLNWTLPTKDDTGAALAAGDITAINIYRDDALIATIDGSATTYTDTLTDSGFYTYSVTAVAEGESVATSVLTNHVGPLESQTLPYTADFSDADIVSTYWTIIDANGDGITWKYYSSYGTQYIGYANQNLETIEDDWLITPPIYFPQAGEYKMTWNGYAYHGRIEFWLGGAAAVDQMILNFDTLTEDDLSSFSRGDHKLVARVPDAGVYYIGIHNNLYPTKGIEYYTYGFSIDAPESGIEAIAADNTTTNGAIYDIYGRRVQHTVPGNIYICNGKKFIGK